MSLFTATMEYKLPVSGDYTLEYLALSPVLYKDMLEYVVPINTKLTKEKGDVELHLTFTYVDMDDKGNPIEYVRKTTEALLTIVPFTNWSDYIPNADLTAIDQRILKMSAENRLMIQMLEAMEKAKVSNLKLDQDTNEMYLVDSDSNVVGDKIDMNTLADELVDAYYDGMVKVII